MQMHRNRKKKIHSSLMRAIAIAAELYDKQHHGKRTSGSQMAKGCKYLADNLRVYPQAIYNWTYVPKNRIMAVHELTGVPLEELAPDLFGGKRWHRKPQFPRKAKP